MLFVLPWLDTSPVRSHALPADLRKSFLLLWLVSLLRADVLRRQAAGGALRDRSRRVATAYYFLYFLVILPLLGRLERPLPLPESIATPGAAAAAGRCPPAPPRKPMEKA